VAAGTEYVVLGGENTASAQTVMSNSAESGTVLVALANGGGFALQGYSPRGYGVVGSSNSGSGVYGTSDSTNGVYGYCPPGAAVLGESRTGYGVHASSLHGVGVHASTTDGLALETEGRVQFSTSGLARIAADQTSVTFAPGVDVTANSFVLLTPKVNLGGRNLWFTTSTAANTITVRISSARTSLTKVAWLLLG
jgi:hypothetical protein